MNNNYIDKAENKDTEEGLHKVPKHKQATHLAFFWTIWLILQKTTRITEGWSEGPLEMNQLNSEDEEERKCQGSSISSGSSSDLSQNPLSPQILSSRKETSKKVK